jgi:hypothetical protein
MKIVIIKVLCTSIFLSVITGGVVMLLDVLVVVFVAFDVALFIGLVAVFVVLEVVFVVLEVAFVVSVVVEVSSITAEVSTCNVESSMSMLSVWAGIFSVVTLSTVTISACSFFYE